MPPANAGFRIRSMSLILSLGMSEHVQRHDEMKLTANRCPSAVRPFQPIPAPVLVTRGRPSIDATPAPDALSTRMAASSPRNDLVKNVIHTACHIGGQGSVPSVVMTRRTCCASGPELVTLQGRAVGL